MAFQQPIFAPVRSAPVVSDAKQQATQAVPTQQAHPAESQEWVLFPTARRPSSSYIQTVSTSFTPQTAGLSRLSEFGSFNGAARSGLEDEDDGALEGDEELDSLDEGLQAFHEHLGHDSTYVDQNGSILPAHDGLGTFQGSGAAVQEHLWRFEQTNLRRKSMGNSRRRSNVQRRLDVLEYDDGARMEKERMERIERWRLEHSRILLEEIERQSRRRSSHQQDLPTADTLDAAKGATADTQDVSTSTPTGAHSPTSKTDSGSRDGDNVWSRIVQSLIYNLMGVDERVLSLIFGEALAGDAAHKLYDLSSTSREIPKQSLVLQPSTRINPTLLSRLSEELGSLLRQFSYTPAALGSPVNPLTLDYAGIPIAKRDLHQSTAPSLIQSDKVEMEAGSCSTPLFKPTLKQRSRSTASDFGHAALWGIEEEPADTSSMTQDREYWEQTPSLKTVFRLLHQHFVSRRRPLPSCSILGNSKPSNVATSSTTDSLRRASVIRQHHPLVSRQSTRRVAASDLLSLQHRRYSSHSIPHLSSSLFRRTDGSCASVSSRKSRRGSGSSRNYWDLGGSIGSGSVGGIGVWGEV
ncbi:MAG: hypothetical protein Q9225_003643 [Loekoesia sp. 1 TL-2023]